MKIYHVAAHLDKHFGGPSYTVPSLCQSLSNHKVDTQLVFLSKDTESQHYGFEHSPHKVCGSDRLGFSTSMLSHLLSNVKEGDVVHLHGLWMAANILPGLIGRYRKGRVVVSPRGMLAPWSLQQSKMKKRVAGLLGQHSVLKKADCIHVTAQEEAEDVRRYGYTGPITLIPNGVDLPEMSDSVPNERRKVIFLSRVHPKKGIEILLDAWEQVQSNFTDTDLYICGPGDASYVEQIKERINKNSDKRIFYCEPVYGPEKDHFYQSSDLFVLPTYNENFGVVVAEALSHCVPAIVSKGAPWQGLIENRCGWWVDNNVTTIAQAIDRALRLPSHELQTMGKAGRQWVAQEFSWPSIGQKMAQTYQWLASSDATSKPEFIQLKK